MGMLFLGKPGISLTGFMFTGKSSVGKTLAGMLDLRFVDLDDSISAAAGMSIEKIFTEQGEEGFRALEREALSRVLETPGRIIATGGGVVIDPLNRELLRQKSCVIWLTARPETILERFNHSQGRPRPLLAVADPRERIVRLLEEREAFYRECDFSVPTDGCSVADICAGIMEKFA